jgi:hypothetical protein
MSIRIGGHRKLFADTIENQNLTKIKSSPKDVNGELCVKTNKQQTNIITNRRNHQQGGGR